VRREPPFRFGRIDTHAETGRLSLVIKQKRI
jgi:hypothetical protein